MNCGRNLLFNHLKKTDLANEEINEDALDATENTEETSENVEETPKKAAEAAGDEVSEEAIEVVVNELEEVESEDDSEDEDRSIYLPFTTFQQAFNQGDHVHWYVMTSKKGIPVSEVEEQAKQLLKLRHDVHPDDLRAIGGWNLEREVLKFNMIFNGIKALSWFVGILTLFAGVIGISNIMLIIIRERTQEIGVRRALGATPQNIIGQIILESLILTVLSGIVGIISGVWLIEWVGPFVQHDYFANPEVDFSVVFTAFMVLVFSGILAGILPSVRAIQIKPIEALRTE